ncbi:acyl carrier protein [Streptomyces sp. NPDC088116]|uniref:acyl carrier protein n=1 Tax=Streptomyces sp. NPDC088116 TaxID=3365825 RepID=UPI00381DA5F8
MSSVSDQVAELLVARFGVGADEVRIDTSMRDLDLDSLTLVEFALVAQQEFGVDVGEDEVGLENTVREIAELIDGKISNKAALN